MLDGRKHPFLVFQVSYIPIHPPTYLPVNPFVHLSVHPSMHPSIHLLTYLSVHPPIHPSFAVHPFVHLSISQFFHSFSQPKEVHLRPCPKSLGFRGEQERYTDPAA